MVPQHRLVALAPIMTGPASGHLLRPFALPATDRQVVRLRDYRQRRNLVLFFHHGLACAACRAVVHMLAMHVPTYRAENAAVLAIDGETRQYTPGAATCPGRFRCSMMLRTGWSRSWGSISRPLW